MSSFKLSLSKPSFLLANSLSLNLPVVNAMALTPACLDWKIVYRQPLDTWVSKSGKICLIGGECSHSFTSHHLLNLFALHFVDSAHPHLPTSAQGASQATEDGACLAICLELAGKGNVRLATLTYERLRYARVLKTQKTGEDTRYRWHSALRDLDAGKEIDPESVKMQVRSKLCSSDSSRLTYISRRTPGSTNSTPKPTHELDSRPYRLKSFASWPPTTMYLSFPDLYSETTSLISLPSLTNVKRRLPR